VTIAVAGDYGKPRPALIVQADAFSGLGSVTVLRLTSELHDWPTFRVTVQPSVENGLRLPSQVMIDRPIALPRSKIGAVFGRLEAALMKTVGQTLLVFLGLDDFDQ
jgi:mRNA interferase MazF